MRLPKLFCLTVFFLVSLLAGITSCDLFQNDDGPRHQIELQNDNLFTTINLPAQVDILINDQFSGEITITIAQPIHGQAALNSQGKILTYTPAKDYVGRDSLTYQVCNRDKCQSAKVLFRMLPDCHSYPQNFTLDKEEAFSNFDLFGPNPCLNGTSELVQLPKHGTVILNNNIFSYTPAKGYIGPDSLVVYTNCPERQECQTIVYRFRIKDPANCQITAFDDHANIWENSQDSGNHLFIRRNDDTCGVAITAITKQPAHGTATVDAIQQIHYIPNKDYTGPDELTYTICKTGNQCASAKVYINVRKDLDFEECKTLLQVNSDKATIPSSNATSKTVNVDVLKNDVVCEKKFYYIKLGPQPPNGTIEVNPDNTIKYTAATSSPGIDRFTYLICASSSNAIDEICKEAEVEITIK